MGIFSRLSRFRQSAFKTLYSENIYYDKLKEIAITLFKWVNLPEEIDARFLELSLFECGEIVFAQDEVTGLYFVMRNVNAGQLDKYDRPIYRRLYANNGLNLERTSADSVIIYNNVLRTSSVPITRYYSDRFHFYDQIVDVNVNAQKTPVLIRCSENERLSVENLYLKYEGGQPIIFGDKALSNKPIDVLKTDAPFVADKIYDMKVKYWNEFLTFFGVSNVNINKKERLTTDEVNRQLGGAIAARGSGMLARKEACKEINRMFDLDIDVVFNEDYQLKVNDPDDELIDENQVDDENGGAFDE